MQTRQNKRIRTKRIYRDRTVTTLTGNDRDQDPFLIAGHDEQHTFNAHPPYVAGPANFNQNQMMPPTFGFGFNSFVGPMNSNNNNLNESQQPYFPQQQPILPPGQNDLEILENLKERIKRGQHEFFRVAPTPAALESLYLGPLAALEEEKLQALPEATSKRVRRNYMFIYPTISTSFTGIFNSGCLRELQQELCARTRQRKWNRQQEHRRDSEFAR